MLHGFAISSFRNFGPEPEWVSPLGRVNIFIGPNNSGKSNVLRYIKRVLAPTLSPSFRKPVPLSSIDHPRNGGGTSRVKLWVPLDAKRLTPNHAWQPKWTEALRALGLLNSNSNFIKLEIDTTGEGHRRSSSVAPAADHQTKQSIQSLWTALTGSSGGGYEQHWYRETLDKMIQVYLEDIKPHYIPSFRQIPTRMGDFSDEYPSSSGNDHIIDQLAGLAYPSYTEQHKKLEFEKLRKFVGDIIDDPNVIIEIPNDRQTVNVNTGGHFLPIETLGSGVHEVFMLASEIVLRSDHAILLEEPEVHLHPHLQRRFMRFVMDETQNQYFITTHSATVIDTPGAQIFNVRNDGTAHVRALVTSQDRFNACRELGFKASDLVQTNCIIWVEGPSDRIYLQAWFAELAPDLIEGIDFSIMFYGGKLLSHLSAEDRELEDFIAILPLCRQAAMILDSDLAGTGQALRTTKSRIIAELEKIGGLAWVTAGREIENYYQRSDREAAVKAVHASATDLIGNRTRFERPLAFQKADGTKVESGFDKVSIARKLVETRAVPSGQLDIDERLSELISFVRNANT